MHVMTPQAESAQASLKRTSKSFFWLIYAAAVSSLLLIAAALWFWGAADVRGNGDVLVLTFFGSWWLVLLHLLFPWLGLSIHDDAWERKNFAAVVALACVIVSFAIAFAAGNLGEGPDLSENFFSAAVATVGLFALWIGMELGGRVSISIAEERDLASGLRFGGLMLSWALILGRAVAGNWHSYLGTIHDFFRDGWVTGVILLVALIIELLVRPSRIRPFPSWFLCGIVPALLYLAAAAAWLWHLGRWEGMPT